MTVLHLLVFLFVGLSSVANTVWAQEADEERAVASEGTWQAVAGDGLASDRNYPGGRDEQDLKLQKDVRPAPPGIDRRTLDQRVLKSYIKKTETDSPKKAQ